MSNFPGTVCPKCSEDHGQGVPCNTRETNANSVRAIAKKLLSRVNQRNITNDDRRAIITEALRAEYLRGISDAAKASGHGENSLCVARIRALAEKEKL